MKKVNLNIEKLRADYFRKLANLNLAEKEKREDSANHNGYIDRPEYQRLCDRKWRASQEVSAIYEFMRDYFQADEVILKRGEYKFSLGGHKYEVIKRELEAYFGWKTSKTTEWRLESADGENAPYHGKYADTKSKLIEDLNWKLNQDLIHDVLGPRPKSKFL